MSMTLISVNIATSEPIATKSGRTGIFKRPQTGDVEIGRLGVAGDTIVDLTNHGGADQAVYIYTREDYAWWENELGRTLAAGTFGENLTISGFESATACVGDRLTIGSLEMEVTSPRMPCITFAVRMGDTHFLKKFMKAKRPGVYCRVLTAGKAKAGSVVEYRHYGGEQITLAELFQAYAFAAISDETRQRYLSAPVHAKLATFLRGETVKL